MLLLQHETTNCLLSQMEPNEIGFWYLEFETWALAAITRARMSEQNIADLLALDTGALKSRLSELRRYL